jgi:ABC-type branched-subunit amino acid transport system ATPase component
MTETILRTDKICKNFKGVSAVKDFSIELEKDQIIGIIGPNGAGKTTIFNLLSHIYETDSGSIELLGKDITKMNQMEIARMGLARTFQNTRLFAGLDVIDNVKAGIDYSGKYNMLQAFFKTPKVIKEEKAISKKAMECLEVLNLDKYKHFRPSSLSYGLQRRVEIARALASNPSLLLLDEPAAGLNPEEVFELVDFIRDVKAKFELSILIIEHRMDLIMNLCDYIYVQDFGNTIAQGVPTDIQENPIVLSAYLGEEE